MLLLLITDNTSSISYIDVHVIIMLSFTLAIGELPHPRTTSISFLCLCYHFHPGWNSKFIHPSVRPLQIHPDKMLQAGLYWRQCEIHLRQNTNERQREVLDNFDYLITSYVNADILFVVCILRLLLFSSSDILDILTFFFYKYLM